MVNDDYIFENYGQEIDKQAKKVKDHLVMQSGAPHIRHMRGQELDDDIIRKTS